MDSAASPKYWNMFAIGSAPGVPDSRNSCGVSGRFSTSSPSVLVELGRLVLRDESLRVPDDPGQRINFMSAEPGTALHLLSRSS
jgi:hypothetical protein